MFDAARTGRSWWWMGAGGVLLVGAAVLWARPELGDRALQQLDLASSGVPVGATLWPATRVATPYAESPLQLAMVLEGAWVPVEVDAAVGVADGLATSLSRWMLQQTGTSMATPFVSGLAGLVLSIAPSLCPDEVEWVLRETAVDLGAPGVDPEFGAGRINAAAAVHAAYVLAATTCRADFSQDGIRDGADITAFVDAYLTGDSMADLAIPFGVFDSRDIARFLDLYINECDGS